jgi:hypothetical protein
VVLLPLLHQGLQFQGQTCRMVAAIYVRPTLRLHQVQQGRAMALLLLHLP